MSMLNNKIPDHLSIDHGFIRLPDNLNKFEPFKAKQEKSFFLKAVDPEFYPLKDFHSGTIIFFDNIAKAKLQRMSMTHPDQWEVCALDLEYEQ